MTYNDITYCSKECANMECKRNQKHIPKDWEIVSMAGFTDCENWKEVDADFMFEQLGYKKEEFDVWVKYHKEDMGIEFWFDDKTITKNQEVELYSFITIPELKAINKKCQELGWE